MSEYEYLNQLFHEIGEQANENADYFYMKKKNTNYNFYGQFQTILNALDPLQIAVEVVTSCCARFDVNTSCKGNVLI